MRRSRLLSAVLAVVVLGGCGDDALPGVAGARCGKDGDCTSGLFCSAGTCSARLPECALCSEDRECAPGFVCSTFSDGARRCASSIGATSCRVP